MPNPCINCPDKAKCLKRCDKFMAYIEDDKIEPILGGKYRLNIPKTYKDRMHWLFNRKD